MTSAFEPDAEDIARIVLARASSKLAVTGAWAAFSDASLAVFRHELATYVTRISSFALFLVETEGQSIDDLVSLIVPPPGWPFRPLDDGGGRPAGTRRRMRAAFSPRVSGATARRGVGGADMGSVSFGLLAGGRVRLHALGHSVEVRGRVVAVAVVSAHGTLRLGIPGPLPRSFREAAVGVLASDVVDIPALRGRDWRVTAVESRVAARAWTFVVEVGSRAFVMPWAR